jgi:myosin-7
MDQKQYRLEKINWESVNFKDNQSTIDLIESKISVFAFLDEETKFPKATDDTWLDKMRTHLQEDTAFSTPKMANNTFGIKHYAGDVNYTVTGFLDKNRDAISDDIIELIKSSKNKYVSQLVPEKNKSTSVSYFKAQLTSLVNVLSSTQAHYVRCIKSNLTQQAFTFDLDLVKVQLRYSGMLDTIKIRKAGYAKRIPFKEFISTYIFSQYCSRSDFVFLRKI